jgi:hypothetical protein
MTLHSTQIVQTSPNTFDGKPLLFGGVSKPETLNLTLASPSGQCSARLGEELCLLTCPATTS